MSKITWTAKNNMKLWLLKPREDLPEGYKTNPWHSWYDKVFGFVVRAETEEMARALVVGEAGDEEDKQAGVFPWQDERYSVCVELLPEGEAEIIMRDFARA